MPTTVSLIESGTVKLLINTPLGRQAYDDSVALRSAAIRFGCTLLTTLSAAQAAVSGIRLLQQHPYTVRSLQVHHKV